MSQYGVIIYIGILCIYQSYSEEFKVLDRKQIKIYDVYVKRSHDWEKRDDVFLKTWNKEFQLQQVNLTAEYRAKIKIHKQLVLQKLRDNAKWENCVKIFINETNKYETEYREYEGDCLRVSYTTTEQEQNENTQLEKEIRKWRKSYKYLKKLCRLNNPDSDDEFSQCLVEYIQKDKYDEVFQRLTSLKQEAMNTISSNQKQAMLDLEFCLQKNFYVYLEKIRKLKNVIEKCYDAWLKIN